jgi:protein-tyrosine phosphatase
VLRGIVNCTDRVVNKYPNVFEYLKLGLKDETSQDLKFCFDECFQFIENHLKNGNSVLIHCMAGKSRSVSIVLAFLIYKKWTLQEALKLVLKKRSNISPNLGFFSQLIEYEKQILGENSINLEQYGKVIAFIQKPSAKNKGY